MFLHLLQENYKVFIPLFKSKVTGKFEKAGILFLQTETKKNVSLGLKFFKQSLPYTENDVGKYFFFLDKDFEYIVSKSSRYF